MKHFFLMTLVLTLCVGMLAGCRGSNQEPTETTPATTEDRVNTMPDTNDMMPGNEDTIDPSNGANRPDATEPDIMEPDVPGTTETTPESDNTRIRPRGRVMPNR